MSSHPPPTSAFADLMENSIPQTTTLFNRMYKKSPSAGGAGTAIVGGTVGAAPKITGTGSGWRPETGKRKVRFDTLFLILFILCEKTREIDCYPGLSLDWIPGIRQFQPDLFFRSERSNQATRRKLSKSVAQATANQYARAPNVKKSVKTSQWSVFTWDQFYSPCSCHCSWRHWPFQRSNWFMRSQVILK